MKPLHAVLMSAVLMLAGALAPALAADKQKVVYHINGLDAKQQAAALGNVQNHINVVGAESLDLRVVMHGDGVSLIMYPEAVGKGENQMKAGNATEEVQARISGLKEQGVKFEICAITLKSRKVDTNDLYDFSEADLVPSGVAELAKLQAEGFAYIKP